jgi:hypothetical protein
MSRFLDSYVSRVLFATPAPAAASTWLQVAVAQNISVRLVPARTALHARA